MPMKCLQGEPKELHIYILFFLIVICPFSKPESTSFTDKKLKKKKEKLSDGTSDDISDCLAVLSLQSSSAPQPQMPPPIIKMDEPVLADYPLGYEWNSNKDGSGISDHPNTPASPAPATTTASPSDSAVISALHLSNIDWDAVSFTSSPPVQSSVGHTAETKPITEMQNASGDCQAAVSRCAAQTCYTECSLRERLLIKNMAKAAYQTEGCKDMVSKQLNYKLPSVTHSSRPNVDTHVPTNLHRIEPLSDKIHYTSNRRDSDSPSAKHGNGLAAQPSSKSTNKHGGSQKPPQKYKFVKKTASSSVVMPRKHCSDPSQSRKNIPRLKNSVCASIASSSEESDTENQQFRPRGKARIKPMTKIKANLHSDVALKPISGPKPPPEPALLVQLPRPKAQSCSLEINSNIMPAWDQDVARAKGNSDAFLQNAASPAAVTDSDDSVVCSESPLPLAERLRLKFLK